MSINWRAYEQQYKIYNMWLTSNRCIKYETPNTSNNSLWSCSIKCSLISYNFFLSDYFNWRWLHCFTLKNWYAGSQVLPVPSECVNRCVSELIIFSLANLCIVSSVFNLSILSCIIKLKICFSYKTQDLALYSSSSYIVLYI